MSPLSHMSESAKHLADAVSLVALVGFFADVVPWLASLATFVWMSIRIFEWWRGRKTED